LPAEARGLAYQLCEAMGSLDLSRATLPPDERAARRWLKRFGVTFGRRAIFFPRLLKPDAASLFALLWGVAHRLERIPPPPQPGITSFDAEVSIPAGFLAAAGFRILDGRAVRLDVQERLVEELTAAAAQGLSADSLTPRLCSRLGCDRASLDKTLAALGWHRFEVGTPTKDADTAGTSASVWRQSTGREAARLRRTKRRIGRDLPSPFAGLARLIGAD
jgi:ATP-dependent RNA helicase SUPV3L1/SUV3